MTNKISIFSTFTGLFFSIHAMADSFTLQLLHFADIDGNELRRDCQRYDRQGW